MSNSLLKNAKIIASLFISLTQILLIQPSAVSAEDYNSSKVITNYGGWFEEAYAEWDSSVIGGNVTVSYAESGSTDFTAVDQELIRGDRVDIPGLKGNTQYTVKIEGDKGETQCSVKTLSFDRSGYAHYNYSDIGAYKDDGTYHHNWFNNTHSRNPRARNAHIHSFNNYFSTNSEYGICASYNSKILSESNCFEKTNSPLYAINMDKDQYSGTIKSFNDKFDNCAPDDGLAYKIVSSRNESVDIPNLISGGSSYDNFDLNMYNYTTQSPDEAKTTVMQLAGRMKSSGEIVVPEPINENVKGDVNGNGTFDIADLVVFQKWMLGHSDAALTNWRVADFNSDNVLDSFDLHLMKRTLIKQK